MSWRSVHAEGVLISPQTDPDITSAVEAAAGLTRDQVMTAGEVADLLHMPVSAVYYLASRGVLPAKRLRRAGVSCARVSRSSCGRDRCQRRDVLGRQHVVRRV